MNKDTHDQELQDLLMDRLKTQASSVNTATQGFSPNVVAPPNEWRDPDDGSNEFERPPITPNFGAILKYLEEDLDLNQVIAVDREIGEIIAMPRVVALSLQRWLQWEVQTGSVITVEQNAIGSTSQKRCGRSSLCTKSSNRKERSNNGCSQEARSSVPASQ